MKPAGIKRSPQELAITIVFLGAALTFLTWANMAGSVLNWAGLLEKVSLAIIVAIAVRWLAIAFQEENKSKDDIYESSDVELYEHLRNARKRIWILQTWLPSMGRDAQIILERRVRNTRLLLSSFKPSSSIYSRIPARFDVNTVPTAKQNSASSVSEFVKEKRLPCVRFNPIHHPGWIAVIDDYVFWGATPVDKDNWAVRLLFHKAHKTDKRAQFWLEQFELLWSGKDEKTGKPWSHDYFTECQYNEYLDADADGKLRTLKAKSAQDITALEGEVRAEVFDSNQRVL